MRIHLDEKLQIGWTVNSFKAGQRSACFAIKCTYRLQNGAEPVPADEPEPLSGDLYTGGDLTKDLIYPSDFAPFKPRADVVVLATAYAPNKRPAPRFNVRIKVGKLDKNLAVVGPRKWRREYVQRSGSTEPQPIASLPVAY